MMFCGRVGPPSTEEPQCETQGLGAGGLWLTDWDHGNSQQQVFVEMHMELKRSAVCTPLCVGKQHHRPRVEKGVWVTEGRESTHTVCCCKSAFKLTNLARQIPLAWSRPFGEVPTESILERPDKILNLLQTLCLLHSNGPIGFLLIAVWLSAMATLVRSNCALVCTASLGSCSKNAGSRSRAQIEKNLDLSESESAHRLW